MLQHRALDCSSPSPSGRRLHAGSPSGVSCAVTARETTRLPTPSPAPSMCWRRCRRQLAQEIAGIHRLPPRWSAVRVRYAYCRLGTRACMRGSALCGLHLVHACDLGRGRSAGGDGVTADVAFSGPKGFRVAACRTFAQRCVRVYSRACCPSGRYTLRSECGWREPLVECAS